MNPKQRVISAVCGVAVLLGLGVWWAVSALEQHPVDTKAFDIIGMLKAVDQTNSAILKANEALIGSLEGVRQQAGAVSGVHTRLQKLEAGLGEQAQVMERLEGITRDQAALSRNLQELTRGVGPSTQRLAATAAQQATAVEAMSRTTAGLAGRMQRIGALNGSIKAKLWTAERVSGEVLELLPP